MIEVGSVKTLLWPSVRTVTGTFRSLFALIVFAWCFFSAPVVHAGSLDSSTLGMFPDSISEFGYADLSAVRDFPWFPQFEAQMVPVALYGFEQFLAAAQMQQGPVIDGVAWARLSSVNTSSGTGIVEPGGGQMLGVAQGRFNPDAIRSFLTAHQVQGVRVGDYVMYGAGTGSGASDVFFVLTSDQTIAFGNEEALKRMLRATAGEVANLLTNDKMMELIGEVNGDSVLWGVFSSAQAQRAVQQIFPDLAKFQQGRDLMSKMKGLSINIKASSNISLDLQVVASTPADASLLSQLLQVALLYKQQTTQSNPDLNRILAGTRIMASGNRLECSLDVDDDQVLGLIEHDTFRVPM